MSIGIYAFLRIYFFGFCLSAFAQFRTRSAPSSSRLRYDLPGVACLVSSAYRCSVSSVRGCVPCLARSAMPPVMCRPSGRAGAGVSTSGVYGESRGWGWSTPRVEKIQKRRSPPTPLFSAQNTPPPLSISKIPPQKQKDPYKGSVFCAILALQALKGRNLQ